MAWRIRCAVVAALCVAAAVPSANAGDFILSSPTVADGHTLPDAHVLEGFGCHGGNRSPELAWTTPPAGTKSLAVTVYDPDAPTGSGWWHWVVFNLPASVGRLPAGAGNGGELPAGAVEGRTDFGTSGFGGACPPPGKPHRYIFTVHALKVGRLDLDREASGAMVGYMIGANSLGSATITATYGR
jgi:Raf kinase inhibitor-like YbhB/YbcL family protein